MDNVTALLYVNGYVIVEEGRVGYSIPASRPMRIRRSITFSQLVKDVHRKLQIDPSTFSIKLSTKYSYSTMSRYIEEHVYITDDDSLQFMFDLPTLECLYLYVESSSRLQNVSDCDFETVMPVITQGFGGIGFNDQAGPSTHHIDEHSSPTYSGINIGPWDHHLMSHTEEDYAWGTDRTRDCDLTSGGWDHHITVPVEGDVSWEANRSRPWDLSSWGHEENTTNVRPFESSTRDPYMSAPINEHMTGQDDLFGDSSLHAMNSDDELDVSSIDGGEDEDVENTNEGTYLHIPMSGATHAQNFPNASESHLREIPQFLNEVYDEQIPDSFGLPSSSRTKFYNTDRPELSVKMVFKSKKDLIASVKDFSVRVLRRQYIVVESSPTLWKIKCKNWSEGGNCRWGLRASLKQKLGYFMITKYGDDHTCISSQVGIDHHNLDVNMIASTLLGIVRCDPAYEIKYVQESIKAKYEYDISYAKAWHSLKRAVEIVYGTWESSVSFLPKYVGALSKYNPGTIIEWKHLRLNDRPIKILNFVFWAFKPCIDGFRHCRNIISVDGTHMYTKYKHKLLIAVTLDANNQVLPLAFALVDEETYESWHWFLSNVARHVTRGCRGVCLISDRHAGITRAVQDIPDFRPPRGVHRFCLRHVCSNFNSKFKNIHLKDLCWEAGTQHQIGKFTATLEAIRTKNALAFNYLSNIPKEKWSLAHDGGWRRGIMTTNMSECINGVLKGARRLPITAIVELTFQRCVQYFIQRRTRSQKMMEKNQPWTDYAYQKFDMWSKKSIEHRVVTFDQRYQTASVAAGSRPGRQHHVQVVNISTRECTCGKWTIFGIPCSHVICAAKWFGLDPTELVQPWFTLSEYVKTYDGRFDPVHDEQYWDEPAFQLQHNTVRREWRRAGRDRTTRIRNEMDQASSRERQRER